VRLTLLKPVDDGDEIRVHGARDASSRRRSERLDDTFESERRERLELARVMELVEESCPELAVVFVVATTGVRRARKGVTGRRRVSAQKGRDRGVATRGLN
jgi:hypothetical protein